MKTTLSGHPCPRCRHELAIVTEKPERGAGCIIAVLGLIFAPVLIGIPLLIWGLVMTGRTKRHFHCMGCGSSYPILTGASRPTAEPQPDPSQFQLRLPGDPD